MTAPAQGKRSATETRWQAPGNDDPVTRPDSTNGTISPLRHADSFAEEDQRTPEDRDDAAAALAKHRRSQRLAEGRETIQRPADWTIDAACVAHPPEWWDDEYPDNTAMARRVCAECPVRRLCLEAGITDPYGVIGGLTGTERRLMLGITDQQAQRPPHGERSRYIGSSRWSGCRCDACRHSHSEYERDARARRKASDTSTRHEWQRYEPPVRNEPARAWDDHPPQHARIEFTNTIPGRLRKIARRGQRPRSPWPDAIICENENPDAADADALDLAAKLESAGATGWRLIDTTGTVIHDEPGPTPIRPAALGEPGWWLENRMPMPGQQWTHDQADRLLHAAIAADAAPANKQPTAA